MPNHVNVSLPGSSAAARVMMIKAAIVAALPIVAAPVTSSANAAGPMALAESGRTRYVIVIGKGADYGEDLAAKELAHFLWGMTGAEFPVERDSEPVSDLEIVLGNTNRKSLDQVPNELKTDNLEGFAIVREDAKLFIMGNSPRATLYGVYDFLDIELGVKFLTAEVTHVPQTPTLTVEMQSRMFAPLIERRTIWEGLGGKSASRNRMNGVSFGLGNRRLGGVVPIGPPCPERRSGVHACHEKCERDRPREVAYAPGARRSRQRLRWALPRAPSAGLPLRPQPSPRHQRRPPSGPPLLRRRRPPRPT